LLILKIMAKLTGLGTVMPPTNFGGFARDEVRELEESGQYFMAAVALALALETAVLTYLVVATLECCLSRGPF
jgi:hypothetical protein